MQVLSSQRGNKPTSLRIPVAGVQIGLRNAGESLLSELAGSQREAGKRRGRFGSSADNLSRDMTAGTLGEETTRYRGWGFPKLDRASSDQ